MKKIFIFLFFLYLLIPLNILAQEINLEVKITKILTEKQKYQKLEAVVTKGILKNKTIILENGNLPVAYIPSYKIGDRLTVSYSKNSDGKESFFIRDFIRRNILLTLFIFFVIITLIITRKSGLLSFLSLGFSYLMIFYSILPNILSGADPVLTVILASLFIIPVTFYLAHGFNKKTTAAVFGTFISIIITGFLAFSFVHLAKLSGFSSEEAAFLQIFNQGKINLQGILLAGIIIGALGVLDDVTISQSSIVFQLRQANKNLESKQLYQQAMNVGQDHISSMINTLILVYTGASLPLLLLFVKNPHPFLEIINYEIISEELIRTLVGSIGLILSVPITTYIAVYFSKNR